MRKSANSEFLNHLDIYEVDKEDAISYCYRLKARPQNQINPKEGLEIFEDVATGLYLWGIETTNIMGQEARRYFIFEFLDEELLGPHRTVKKITLTEKQFEEFVKRCLGEYKNNEEKENDD